MRRSSGTEGPQRVVPDLEIERRCDDCQSRPAPHSAKEVERDGLCTQPGEDLLSDQIPKPGTCGQPDIERLAVRDGPRQDVEVSSVVLHETQRVQRGCHNHAHGDANSRYAAGSIGILAQSESSDRTSVLQACGEPGQDEGKNTPPNRLECDCAGQYGPIQPSRQIERADREVVEGTIRRRCERANPITKRRCCFPASDRDSASAATTRTSRERTAQG